MTCPRRALLPPLLALVWGAGLATTALAAPGTVIVHVSGLQNSNGEVGCALFSRDQHFPMDASGARQIWVRADRTGVTCTFDEIPEGRWAVSASQDLNGNHKVDTNLFGIPTEPWGVSNNVRPTLRAPRFDEAAFEVAAGQATVLDVSVAK